MLNTKFGVSEKETVEAMTKLYSQIFAVAMQVGKPTLQTIIYLNDNFEDIYLSVETDVEVYETIFDELGIQYKTRG